MSGLPKYTTTISYPEIKGKLKDYLYVANGFSVDIEIVKQGDIARRIPVPVSKPVPVVTPAQKKTSDWVYAGGILLLVGAVVVVVATVAEDIATVGVGAADDPASFALAAAMTERGLALLRGAQVVVTRLGTAATPAGVAFAH